VVAKLSQNVVAKLNQIVVAKLNQIVVARAMALVNLAIALAFLVRVACYHHYSLAKAAVIPVLVAKLSQNVVAKLNQIVVVKLNQIVVAKLSQIVVAILAATNNLDGLYWTTCLVVSENPADVTRPTAVTPVAMQTADVTRPTAVTPVAMQTLKKQPRCPQHRLSILLHSCRKNDVSFKLARQQSFAKRQFT